MDHVGGGIVELGRRQRPAAPVGEAAALVDVDAQHLAHHRIIGDLLAEAGGHGGDLGVEQGLGDDPQVVEDLHVLAAGVEYLLDGRVGHQRQERRHVQFLGQGVDHPRDVGSGRLDQA